MISCRHDRPQSKSALFLIGAQGDTRRPAPTAVGVGGLLGGLDDETRSHVAIRNWMVFSLEVLTTKEDGWDRDAIARGSSGCRDFAWCRWTRERAPRQRRILCRHCGIRTERVEFATPKARVTRRLRQQIGVDCQSMPTSDAAVRHGVTPPRTQPFMRPRGRTSTLLATR